MNTNQLKELCTIYNSSDFLALRYLIENNLCSKSQLNEVFNLLDLNYKLCFDPGYLEDEENYHSRIQTLFSQFGLYFYLGDACYTK